jgi:carbon storage regulator
MLVLTRKRGERILIGDDIVITIIDTKGDNVRIGIDAPSGVRIHRAEIVEAVTQANRDAAADPDAESQLARLLAQSSAAASAGAPSAEAPPAAAAPTAPPAEAAPAD